MAVLPKTRILNDKESSESLYRSLSWNEFKPQLVVLCRFNIRQEPKLLKYASNLATPILICSTSWGLGREEQLWDKPGITALCRVAVVKCRL